MISSLFSLQEYRAGAGERVECRRRVRRSGGQHNAADRSERSRAQSLAVALAAVFAAPGVRVRGRHRRATPR